MKRTDSGFTLVEVLAALAVFSTAALALVNLNNETVSSARQLDLKVLAEIEAENRMARLWLSTDPLAPGIRTGETRVMGNTFEWSETIASIPNSDLTQISIAVNDQHTQQTLMRLSALRQTP